MTSFVPLRGLHPEPAVAQVVGPLRVYEKIGL
ncbi:MAG: hypothetical protein JWM68_2042 [Verrucomicrobiales bacterium]|nr:hypothetical protein [Verrucomicrobiales bacterium]